MAKKKDYTKIPSKKKHEVTFDELLDFEYGKKGTRGRAKYDRGQRQSGRDNNQDEE